jgi:hypothetical protein
MSRKPETVFYTAVHRLLPRALHVEKMNNPYRGGTADMWYSGNLRDLWVEYKWLPRAPRKEFIPDLSALQLKWLRERHGEGRNVAVIIGCPTGVMLLRDLDWESPISSNFALTRQDAANWIAKETHAPQNENAGDSS